MQKTKEKLEEPIVSHNTITEEIENKENEVIQTTEEKITEESTKKILPKKQNKILKSIGITIETLCVAILIMAIIIMIRALVYKKYDVFGNRVYMIMSGSMEPTIHVGDAVIAKETTDLKLGDIIAFKLHDSITVHRIIKIDTQGDIKLYQTKGDNNNTQDKGELKQEQITGKIVLRIPKAGNAILFLQRNIIIVVIFIVAMAVIITLARRLF